MVAMEAPSAEQDFVVDGFLMGVSKAASTWIYRCLGEHPDVFVPRSDSLKFFDLQYHLGISEYQRNFAIAPSRSLVVDPSPTYLRSPVAARRIARHFPDARFVISLRNPVDRAFSQYWHEKKQGRLLYDFDDCLKQFLLFPWIIEHGFYTTHLLRLLDFYPKEKVRIVLYDNLLSQPSAFLDEVLQGLQVQRGTFVPSILGQRVNQAGAKETGGVKALRAARNVKVLQPVRRFAKRLLGERRLSDVLGDAMSTKEYDQGISADQHARLLDLYMDEICELEALFGLDLRVWKVAYGAPTEGPQ